MEELKKQVAVCKDRWNVASTEREIYDISCFGNHYAILVTKGVWYKVRIFVHDEYQYLDGNSSPKYYGEEYIGESEHLTLAGMEERISLIRNFFKTPDIKVAVQLLKRKNLFDYKPYAGRTVPKDYAPNPDKYLNRGDMIATDFYGVSVHTGIYLGNGLVGHISGHGGGKSASVARIGNLLGDFVSSEGADELFVMYMKLRIRPGEEIAKKAEEFAANKFRQGEYHALKRNCQRFVFLCATGVEWPEDL